MGRALVNPHFAPASVPPPRTEALAFHRAWPGFAATSLRPLTALAAELGLASVALKDESDRLGLPAFKVLGASWAAERLLREDPEVHTLVAASAGNHGRAVAHVAAARGLGCRIFLPARATADRRAAIASEGAEVVVVDGDYQDALAAAVETANRPGVAELADTGDSGPAHWVIDGYATLFAELDVADVVLVPVGVGSLGAAAARFAAQTRARAIAVEPVTAAGLTASLEAGTPTAVETPGTTMAGLDCAEVSPAAWPSLRDGLTGTVTVSDAEAHAAMRELAALGLRIGDSGAATLAALRALATDPACADLRAMAGLGPDSRVVLIATEGATDPAGYARTIAA